MGKTWSRLWTLALAVTLIGPASADDGIVLQLDEPLTSGLKDLPTTTSPIGAARARQDTRPQHNNVRPEAGEWVPRAEDDVVERGDVEHRGLRQGRSHGAARGLPPAQRHLG